MLRRLVGVHRLPRRKRKLTAGGNANSQPAEYNASIPWQKVVEECLRYFVSGLPTKNAAGNPAEHEFLATSSQQGHWVTANWLEVWNYELVEGASSGGGGGGCGS